MLNGLRMEKFPRVEVFSTFDMCQIDVRRLQVDVANIKGPAVPRCLAAARDAVVEPLLKTMLKAMPPSNLTATLFRKLAEAQFFDSIDTLSHAEGDERSAFGINVTSCVSPDALLVTEDLFGLFVEVCAKYFCKDVHRTVIEELQLFSRPAPRRRAPPNATVSIFGLSDTSIFDFLTAVLPGQRHTRPQVGAFVILETRGDDTSIFVGKSITDKPQLMDTVNIFQLIQALRRKILND